MNNEAERFLAALDPAAASFTFQTFDDNKERARAWKEANPKSGGDPKYTRVLNGTFAKCESALRALNEIGAGVFVTINETNGRGRKATDIIRVRAVFVDLDGVPLKKVLDDKELDKVPNIIVESSKGKWHCYWLLERGAVGLDKFTEIQELLAARYKSDKSVKDLSRVLRVPGFVHKKGKPFTTRIESISDLGPYDSFIVPGSEEEAEFVPEYLRNVVPGGRGTVESKDELDKYQTLNKKALEEPEKWVPALFDKFIKMDDGRYRITSKMLKRDLQEDLSISPIGYSFPPGIIDFGLADMGDPREGKRTPIELVSEHSKACKGIKDAAERFMVAYVTLAKRLGVEIPDEPDGLEILVRDGEISRAVDETQKAILKTKRPVFVRGGNLVEPIWTEYPTQAGGKVSVTTFKALGIETLRYMINKHKIKYVRWDNKSKKLVEMDPPDKVMATLVKLGHWSFPRVAGIINAPTMRPDGSILSERGYDAATQLWCWPDADLKMPTIKDKPTKKDALEAVELLKDLLTGFPLQMPLDRSVVLAAILTTVLRGAFDIAPMVLFLAHMAGTGKSYLVDLISTIVRGRPCPVITASRNEDEMEKRIGSLLIESIPIISLDNLSFDLKSDVLCQMCTQQNIKIRILGKSETADCEWKGTMFATGNNVNLSGDMTRRGLICNLDAGMERPELREFEFSPIDRVLRNQGAYIAAALTIARAYVVSGAAAKCGKIASFGPWSKFVREPLIWLGEEDCTKSMDQAYKNDPNKEAAETLMAQWKEHLGTENGYKVSEIIEKAKETMPAAVMGTGMSDWDHVRPDFFEVLAERCGDRGNIDIRKVGFWLRSLRGQIYSGYKIVVGTKDDKHGNKWKLESLNGSSH